MCPGKLDRPGLNPGEPGDKLGRWRKSEENTTQQNKGTFPNFRLLERFTWDSVWLGVMVKHFPPAPGHAQMSSPGSSRPHWGWTAAAFGGAHECGVFHTEGTFLAQKPPMGVPPSPACSCGRASTTDMCVTISKWFALRLPGERFPSCDSTWIPLQAPLLLPQRGNISWV